MTTLFKINKPVEFVFDHLTDMQKFVSIHPVITKMDQMDSNNYLVHETLKMGFIPFAFTYPASVVSNDLEKSVVMKAVVMKLTKVDMYFKIKPENGGSLVEETIIFKSPLPVKYMMQKIFKKQHAQLFYNMGL